MGRACDMPSDIIDMPTLSPENTPPPDETPSATVSHTHIRKLSLSTFQLKFSFLFSICFQNVLGLFKKVLLK